MRIPPYFFSDDSKSTASPTGADPSRFMGESLESSLQLEETLLEGTLKLPGVDAASKSPSMVSVRLGDILEPLKDAIRSDRAFLSDFADDDVQLPADLIDCLKAYGDVRRAA
jgi:hypothetical protein